MIKFSLILLVTIPLMWSMSYAKGYSIQSINTHIEQNHPMSGMTILDQGEQALLARAWLADHAKTTIDVQYFIWSSDNVGILAAEALLKAAERGVKIRVIVDDLLIDAPDENLLALAQHPNVQIKIYNPLHSVGTSFVKRLYNVFAHFREANQRMHDKTFIVDQQVVITGGRNMADEYFDFNQEYNFRDRDALVVGPVVQQISDNFNQFWRSELTETIQQRFKGDIVLTSQDIQSVYDELHQYAQSSENFEPAMRQSIQQMSQGFEQLMLSMEWTELKFIHDNPGKNNQTHLHGGGLSSIELANLINQAESEIIIQSPYLVLSKEATDLFQQAIQRGVDISISTNSMLSTDNLQAFSGYQKQRDELIEMGIKVFEYKPYPAVQRQLIENQQRLTKHVPIFTIHAKSMVIDSYIAFVGTYNLDPRSQNLNTEVGVIAHNSKLAEQLASMIKTDMKPENSWSATENSDQYASFSKRLKSFLWQIIPMNALL